MTLSGTSWLNRCKLDIFVKLHESALDDGLLKVFAALHQMKKKSNYCGAR